MVIYTTILLYNNIYFFYFETYIPNGSEEDTPRCDVVTHYWYPGWRSSMPTELGCHRQETTAAGYWFSCKPKAYPQVPLNIPLLFCISVTLLSSSDLTVSVLAKIFCDLFCLNISKKSRSPKLCGHYFCEAPQQLSPAPKPRSRTRNWIPLAF